ncbi:MAG: YigZ family protein [bacterium]|nr:YigZ family protein [bacterium]
MPRPDHAQPPPPLPPDAVRVLTGPGRAELTEQRSRFLGFAIPAPDEETARSAVAALRRENHAAHHACSAWRLGTPPPPREYRHDDGEPAGTAGEPILAALRRADLTNALVVVVRYFGGVKLGTGGLARAYGSAAALALSNATAGDLPLGRVYQVEFPYALRHLVAAVVESRGGHPLTESYGVQIAWEIWLPHSGCRGFVEAIVQATAGAIVPREKTG